MTADRAEAGQVTEASYRAFYGQAVEDLKPCSVGRRSG
jgi:hypothetical protein